MMFLCYSIPYKDIITDILCTWTPCNHNLNLPLKIFNAARFVKFLLAFPKTESSSPWIDGICEKGFALLLFLYLMMCSFHNLTYFS